MDRRERVALTIGLQTSKIPGEQVDSRMHIFHGATSGEMVCGETPF